MKQSLQINRKLHLRNDQYYPAVNKKDSIFLHHTSGSSARGAFDWWNQTPDHVGTAYIIERDGTIYEVFEPNQWGFHLGLKGDDDYMEKHSIGIEIVSLGQLEKVGRDFIFYPIRESDDAIILELKVDHTPDEAIAQIKEKEYALRLKGKLAEKMRYTGRILAVGIGYDKGTKQHRCKVEELKG